MGLTMCNMAEGTQATNEASTQESHGVFRLNSS